MRAVVLENQAIRDGELPCSSISRKSDANRPSSFVMQWRDLNLAVSHWHIRISDQVYAEDADLEGCLKRIADAVAELGARLMVYEPRYTEPYVRSRTL